MVSSVEKGKRKEKKKRKKEQTTETSSPSDYISAEDNKKRKEKKNNEAISTSKHGKDDLKTQERKKRKKLKKEKKQKRKRSRKEEPSSLIEESPLRQKHARLDDAQKPSDDDHCRSTLKFDYKYVLAPMVGASELAFRLLCRKYGAQLAYTPMMSSTRFAREESYRKEEFQTIPEDRPLVCHFSANNPEDFAAAAKLCESQCDAIDLNLGCPQRTAYVGHFGSYLLDTKDREMVLSIVRAGAQAVQIPIFCKIRLLDTVEATIELCRQLRDAGASLIAIHARYRASFERKGPGARDGPAMLDQVLEIKKAVTGIPIIANGNVVTFQDVVNNLQETKADGIMSAEGILDNPALFLPHLGSRDDSFKQITIADPSPLSTVCTESKAKKERKLLKKLREIEKIEEMIKAGGKDCVNDDRKQKLVKKTEVQKQIVKLRKETKEVKKQNLSSAEAGTSTTTLAKLYQSADDCLELASEYLSLVRRYPIKIRTVIFHTRRMLKDTLDQYQLMEDCVACHSVDEVDAIIQKCKKYRADPDAFTFDRAKAARQKEALEKKRREEGKRKAFEARMIRKAKREGLADLEHYLRLGAVVPTVGIIRKLRSLPRDQQLTLWKKDHSQHCMSYHLDPDGCERDRACAFLHVDATGTTTFVESDEVAG